MSNIAPPISEQIVLVSGGARGLGRAISEAFLREGARVLINYHSSAEAAAELVAKFPERAFAAKADVRNRAEVDQLYAAAQSHFGAPVTTVISNALVNFSFNGDARPHAEDIKFEHFEQQFAGSIQGTLNLVQAALPSFTAYGSGRVITIGTNLFQNPVVPYHDYTAAKAALLSLTRTFAADLGPKNIRVNMLSGGLLRTTDASAATPDEVFDLIAQSTPLQAVTTPAEFAGAALFFASPWSRAITGQNLVVDGGLVKN